MWQIRLAVVTGGFISLDVAALPSKGGDSRLVREDDEIGEGDDGQDVGIFAQLKPVSNNVFGNRYG